ncbi:MAG: thiol-disulfide oxidoreductase DCC family protein [Gemmataceae bacterium]|nr:thiol-disulfide oxidoreductase DCC family protein [Gemmataceae bacterium]
MEHPIILFDGVCRFCDGSVNWIIDHDTAGRFRFAALQSPMGQALLARFGLPTGALDSMVLVEGGKCWTRSTAALRIAARLGWPWRAGAGFLLLPAFLRDPLYEVLARNRYRWFGTLEACRVPTPEVRERFLDGSG